ncbi:MAG: D-hexose-6-phosphate mutarotase [Gammaproteobacteria bacterium]|nr:D-hexose-6-phosphate mutarotase [Gammaproteobacteria bacterium]
MTNVTKLNEQWRINDQLYFEPNHHGLIIANINNQHASASIALQGAHLVEWMPTGEKPAIWLSPDATLASGKSIRGGVPVCWPWFGAHSTEADFPAHGFARTVPWQVINSSQQANSNTQITLQLDSANIPSQQWPYPTSAQCQITIGKTLEIALTTFNKGKNEITISEALHTYFAVSDVRNISIYGLDACHYLDKVDSMKTKQQTGNITFSHEVDRLYIDTEATCIIHDPGLARQIHIRKTGSCSTVVWNPWIEKSIQMGDMGRDGYLNMVCVESANAANNLITIPAGGKHQLSVSYHLSKI